MHYIFWESLSSWSKYFQDFCRVDVETHPRVKSFRFNARFVTEKLVLSRFSKSFWLNWSSNSIFLISGAFFWKIDFFLKTLIVLSKNELLSTRKLLIESKALLFSESNITLSAISRKFIAYSALKHLK